MSPGRVALAAACAALALPGSGCGDEPGDPTPPPVRAEPALLGPADTLHVIFPTPYSTGDATRLGRRARPRFGPATAQSYDNYHVIFDGPGGRACGERLHFAVGYETRRQRTRERAVTIRPTRYSRTAASAATWCPGRYHGHVEYRQPDRQPRIPFEPLGRFAFRVR
jgi:hypothetical protein